MPKNRNPLPDLKSKFTRGYMARAMVLASMPHSDPKERYFERKNGNYTLSMQALNKEASLPYGSIPRLILAWITTEAVRTKERTLYLGKNMIDFMRKLGIEPTGGKTGTIAMLKDQMRRLSAMAVSFVYSEGSREEYKRDKRALRMIGINLFLTENYKFWWDPENPEREGPTADTITLSERFFDEITERPVVLCMETLRALSKSPLALDVYMWLTYKNSYAREATLIPWESLQSQFGTGYPEDSKGKSNFKRKFKESLKKIGEVYPEAEKLQFHADGLLYIPGEPHVPKLY